MRVLFVTWDGAGSLAPTAALIAALAARGHQVYVLGHDSQELEIQRNGGRFLRYPNAPQLDQGSAQSGFDFASWLKGFDHLAARDFLAESMRLDPDLIVIDCMMGSSIAMGWSTGKKLVALVHGAYSAMTTWSEAIAAADLALNCSYAAFDDGMKFPRNMSFVGPLRTTVAGPAWQRKLPERPLVVASLSTGIQGPFQLGLLQRVADALSALPVEALITTGRGIAPEEITAAPHITVERSVDHAVTLPGASLFITHAGHGSIMASLRAGVPMLCLPPIADQPHNARLVERLGLGETLDVVSPPSLIADAVTRLLADKKKHKAAQKFARKKTFDPSAEKAAQLLEKLAR